MLSTSHNLKQSWPRLMSLYGVTGPQWVIKINMQTITHLDDKITHSMIIIDSKTLNVCCNVVIWLLSLKLVAVGLRCWTDNPRCGCKVAGVCTWRICAESEHALWPVPDRCIPPFLASRRQWLSREAMAADSLAWNTQSKWGAIQWEPQEVSLNGGESDWGFEIPVQVSY